MVDSTGTVDRAQIKKELHEFAQKHLAAFDTYTDEVDKAEIEIDGKPVKTVTRRVHVDGMGYVLVNKGDIGGMTIAKFKAFRDNICENMAKMDPGRVVGTKLPDKEGCDMVSLTQIKFPVMMSNRVIVNAFYF